jgi:KDO2-lipid IV(A) lauroyltransferase
MALNAYHAGFDGAEVYRPINNPFVNAWIVRQRRRFAYPLQVSKTGEGARTLLKTLKAGKSLAMLADQKHREGLAIPFFGRDAMTVPGPAVLSLRTGAALVPATMVRTGGARFHMSFWPELTISRTGDSTADISLRLTAINAWLEDAVRANPSMWLWAHDRWDDRPRKNRKPVRPELARPRVEGPGAPGTS